MTSKPRSAEYLGISMEDTCLPSMRCPVQRRRDSHLELHVHHLYRTADNPWDEPDIHLLTLCKLCHEQQTANPKGVIHPPKRTYVTDEEWWEEHEKEYSEELREELTGEGKSANSPALLLRLMECIKTTIHVLRLDWEENGAHDIILTKYKPKRPEWNWLPSPYYDTETEMDEMWVAYKTGGVRASVEVLKQRARNSGKDINSGTLKSHWDRVENYIEVRERDRQGI